MVLYLPPFFMHLAPTVPVAVAPETEKLNERDEIVLFSIAVCRFADGKKTNQLEIPRFCRPGLEWSIQRTTIVFFISSVSADLKTNQKS
jgi:hypothetical protein